MIITDAYGAGAVSGGCFNTSVALGIDGSSAGLGFGWCAPYILFELADAALAAVLFKVVRPEDFEGEKTLTTELMSEFHDKQHIHNYGHIQQWYFFKFHNNFNKQHVHNYDTCSSNASSSSATTAPSSTSTTTSTFAFMRP